MTNATNDLAVFASRLKYEQIPDAVIQKMKISLLDSIGCAMAGINDPAAVRTYLGIRDHCLKSGGFIIGRGNAISEPEAILINSMMCHAVEMDDLHKASKVHPGAVVAMGVFSMAFSGGFDGKQVLTAMTVGYETMIRLGEALGTVSHRKKGWHATATCGAVAMAAAAGNLLGLSSDIIANALGLAACQSSGNMAFLANGAMTKRFQVGKSAQNGWLAMKLAAAGVTGSTKAIEYTDGGLLHLMSDDADVHRITEGLGLCFEAVDIGWKMYACCGHTHQAIEAALSLRKEYSIRPEDIDFVEVLTYEVSGLDWGTCGKPQNAVEGQFNFPYVVATALIEGEVFLDQFSQKNLDRDDINDLAERVIVRIDEQSTKEYPSVWSSEVIIHLRNGSILDRRSIGAKGDKDHPLNFNEAQNKFNAITSNHLSETQREQLGSFIAHLENAVDLRKMYELLITEERNNQDEI